MRFPKQSILGATLTLMILAALGVFSQGFSIGKVDLVREPLKNFPARLGDYESRDIALTDTVLGVLAPTEVLVRAYSNSRGDGVTLYIPFFETQDDRSRIHSPKSCMVGGGFRFVRLTPYTLKYRGEDVVVNWVLTRRGDDKQVVLYWIHSRGRILTNEYLSKLYLMWDAVTRKRTDGALVRCITPVRKGETVKGATERAASFAQMVLDEVPSYLPD